MNEKNDKIAFITGANRGLGLETARELGEKGITVILGARDLAKGQAAAEKLKSKGINAIPFQFDINETADHQSMNLKLLPTMPPNRL